MSYESSANLEWWHQAKCRGMDTELWFPPRDKIKYKEIATKSKSVCFGKDGFPECPVRLQCLFYSEDMDEQHGIWGGMSHRERNALKRKAAKVGLTLEEWVLKHGNKRGKI